VTQTIEHPPQVNSPTPKIRRRILVSSFAISPARGSEPGVGWQICSRLAKYHDVTVLCGPGSVGPDGECFRNEIAEYTKTHGPVPGLTIRFVEPPLLSFLFQRESSLCRRTVYYIGYAAWQRAVLKVAQQLHRERPFDLIHQLNMTGYREPGYLWKINAPFVWGPVGGAANFPPKYFGSLNKLDAFFYRLRNFMNQRQMHKPRCLAAAARAQHMWAIGPEDVELVQGLWHHQVERLLETGATARDIAAVRTYDGKRPLRIVWSGRHQGRKALPILLHAMTQLESKYPVELTVLGDGVETKNWRAIADSLKLTNIKWTGNISQAAALAEVSRSDVLAFTSVLEGTPHAVVEALSLGVPVICHRACGMGSAVTPQSGILIEMEDPAKSIAAFAAALRKLSSQPIQVALLSRGALDRAAELSWDRLVEKIVEGYDRGVTANKSA
jgi:glycosyltransferase involved in cell wall biosynthesis